MIRVGVIRGGPSSHYEMSLDTGGSVLSHLRSYKLKEKYKPIDILIDKNGAWHVGGKQVDLDYVHKNVDVVFNALHGTFGQDGKIQQILDQWGISYTGSGAFTSALVYNKILAKERLKSLGVNIPNSVIITLDSIDENKDVRTSSKEQALFVLGKMPPPWVVKPTSSIPSVTSKVCRTFPELENAIIYCIESGVDILIEEMIEGKEANVSIINKFRNKDIYALPPVEVKSQREKDLILCPGNFSNEEKEELINLASSIHIGLNLDHYSRSVFILHPKKGIYTIDVDTLPTLSDTSLTLKALDAVGSSMPEFIDHVLDLALKHK